ncbi:Major facilitator superfamily domain-containing protein 6 [Holothuria leucospilota]|uniref:Major facilitator superfamily domain-containing protein 6 n=1 Tax=Holothuria leucospilota TaxID=206669 RepID=A0A9Q1H992_HOLLE|nr:Major facilitator superfamily domain-containing protein 6 [Holothuria leucospilota]
MKFNEERKRKPNCNSTLERRRWLTLSVNINKTFLPVKLTYYLYLSAWAVIKPYLPIFMYELGMNAAQIGILRAIEPVTNFVASPVWGTVADKFNIHKMLMLACVIGSSICISLFVFVPNVTNLDEDRHSTEEFLPLMPTNIGVSGSRENLSFTTVSSQTSQKENNPSKLFPRDSLLSFILCALITTTENIFDAGFMPLFDSNTMELCRYYPGNTYGGQRAMGALAVGVISPFVGYLFDAYKYIIDAFSFSLLGNSWVPFFFMYTVVMLLTLIPVSKLKVVPMQPPESFSKEVIQLFRDRQIFITFLVVVVCGISYGIAGAFLLLFLEELHASRLLMSLTLVMTCAPETICLMFSGRIIKALTYEGVFCLGLFAYAIRFLGYSTIPEKATWVVLPVESLHGMFWTNLAQLYRICKLHCPRRNVSHTSVHYELSAWRSR